MQWSHMMGVAARAPARRARTAAEAGAARARHGRRVRPDGMDVRSAAGAQRPPQLRQARRRLPTSTCENLYGDSTQRAAPRNADRPVRRAVEPARTARRAAAGARRPACSCARTRRARPPVVNETVAAGPLRASAPGDLSHRRRQGLGRGPDGIHRDAAGTRRELALEWRLRTREIFESYFARGFRAVDFELEREHGRGRYLLARP